MDNNSIVFIFGFIFGGCFIGIVWAVVRFVIHGNYEYDIKKVE